jgi:hypothetical protein
LDLAIGLTDGWVRLWHQGELLEVPGELNERLERLKRKSAKQAREITKLKGQMQDLLAWLRQTVEQKAQKAGRQDILEQLADAEQMQLQQWIAELD